MSESKARLQREVNELREQVQRKNPPNWWTAEKYVNRIEELEAEFAAAQSRADGYELFVKELVGHLVVVTDFGSAGGGWADWACLCCHATRFAAADAKPQIVHEHDCILAADPEARAALLLKEQKESA